MLSDKGHVIDASVLLLFLLVNEEGLLGDLLGWPLRVPVAVYDPEDRSLPLGASPRLDMLSEVRQAVKHYEREAASGRDPESLCKVRRVDSLYEEGLLVAEAMSTQEHGLANRLQSSNTANFGLRAPLGAGSAACVAIASNRRWTIITEDSDVLVVLARLGRNQGYKHEKIRELLFRAASERLITKGAANRIHSDMVSHGFWDSVCPFP